MSLESAMNALGSNTLGLGPKPTPVSEPVKQESTSEQKQVADPLAEQKQKPAEDSFSDKASLLLKKERRLVREKEEMRALKSAIEAQKAEIASKLAPVEQFEALKRSNPLEALKALGYSYNDLTQYYLNNGQPTPEQQVQMVKQEIEQVKLEQQEAFRKQAEEAKLAAEAELNDTLTEFKSSVTDFVSSNADEYEFINLFDQTSLVYDTIEKYYDKHQKILSIKEASDLVEKYLEDQVQKTTATKKFQKIYQKPEAQGEKSQAKGQDTNQPKIQAQSRTLSNNMTSSAAAGFLPAKTENDRMARAMAALNKS